MNYSYAENTTQFLEVFNTTSAPPIHPDADILNISSIILISVLSIFSGLFLWWDL